MAECSSALASQLSRWVGQSVRSSPPLFRRITFARHDRQVLRLLMRELFGFAGHGFALATINDRTIAGAAGLSYAPMGSSHMVMTALTGKLSVAS